jgi:hypothetical protein
MEMDMQGPDDMPSGFYKLFPILGDYGWGGKTDFG